MHSSIILFSCLFGSVYIFSKSLDLINRSLLSNDKILYKLVVINGLVFIISGYIFIHNFKLLNSYHFKN